jgi:hypothetical protein
VAAKDVGPDSFRRRDARPSESRAVAGEAAARARPEDAHQWADPAWAGEELVPEAAAAVVSSKTAQQDFAQARQASVERQEPSLPERLPEP